jgi:thiamine-phosphate pyrophosphorylase
LVSGLWASGPSCSGLYVILDRDVAQARGWGVPALAAVCAAAGARLVQVRDKHASSGDLLVTTLAVLSGVHHRAAVVVNDRADVAACVGADGVHVGQDDLPTAAVRRIVGPDAIVGRSTHTRAQIDAALGEPISYLAVGPVFSTTTKDTGYESVGLDLVAYAARRAARVPVVAIGGLTLERAASVRDAGASAIAVISDLFAGGDVAARVREYAAILR